MPIAMSDEHQGEFGIGLSRDYLLQPLDVARKPASLLVKAPALAGKACKFSRVLHDRFAACLSDPRPAGHDL